MSQTTAASSSVFDFFTGYFKGNESSQHTIPLMNVPPPPTDTSQPPPPLPSGTNAVRLFVFMIFRFDKRKTN